MAMERRPGRVYWVNVYEFPRCHVYGIDQPTPGRARRASLGGHKASYRIRVTPKFQGKRAIWR